MRRGLKRKLDKILDNFEEEPDPYQQGLGDFQSAARKRESMRIKNQVRDGFGYLCAFEHPDLACVFRIALDFVFEVINMNRITKVSTSKRTTMW